MDFQRLGSLFAVKVEMAIILMVIGLNVMDFFGVLPAHLDLIKRIISWTLLGVLIYKMGLSKLLFSRHSKKLDALLITAFFLMMIKNVQDWASALWHETQLSWMKELFSLILINSWLSMTGLLLGSSLLFIAAVVVVARFSIKPPGVLSILGSRGRPENILQVLGRYLKCLLVLFGFFVIVFSLFFEWLGLVIDSVVVVIVLVFYFFYLMRHFHRYDPESAIFRLGDAGERFYETVLDHFRYRKYLLLGISGMLMLHLLADFGAFIVPYIVGRHDVFYYSALSTDVSLPGLLQEAFHMPFMHATLLSLAYLLSLVGVFMLMAAPAFLWYHIYNRSLYKIRRWLLSIFYLSLPSFGFFKAFSFISLHQDTLVGVHIVANRITAHQQIIAAVLTVSAALAVLVYFSSKNLVLEKTFFGIAVSLSQIFFLAYIALFVQSVYPYFFNAIISVDAVFNLIVMSLIFLIQIFFYPFALIYFQYELMHDLKKYIRY